MLWFSSDFHLGHTNIAGPKVSQWPRGYRDFDSVEQMDRTIIDTVNKYVQQNDILYFLGDFTFAGHRRSDYRNRLVVKEIHFMKGNHDKKLFQPGSGFSTVQDVCKIVHNNTAIFMSHYGHRVWPHSHKGSIHLYGHSHDSLPPLGKSMDVGVDTAYRLTGEYRPFSIEEIMKIMEKQETHKADHHGEETN